jgi:hypothetical protein
LQVNDLPESVWSRAFEGIRGAWRWARSLSIEGCTIWLF